MYVLGMIVLFYLFFIFFFFKQKTAYEMRISDWSSDVCSSDLHQPRSGGEFGIMGGAFRIDLEFQKAARDVYRTGHQARLGDLCVFANVNEPNIGIADEFNRLARGETFNNGVGFRNQLFRGACWHRLSP